MSFKSLIDAAKDVKSVVQSAKKALFIEKITVFLTQKPDGAAVREFVSANSGAFAQIGLSGKEAEVLFTEMIAADIHSISELISGVNLAVKTASKSLGQEQLGEEITNGLSELSNLFSEV